MSLSVDVILSSYQNDEAVVLFRELPLETLQLINNPCL